MKNEKITIWFEKDGKAQIAFTDKRHRCIQYTVDEKYVEKETLEKLVGRSMVLERSGAKAPSL